MKPNVARALRQPDPVGAARQLGEQAGQMCLALEVQRDPAFSERAYAFIVSHVRAQDAPISGELITLACKASGIVPRDDRAFGPVYAKAIRNGEIRVVGFCARARGHGTAGGRLYAAGVGQ